MKEQLVQFSADFKIINEELSRLFAMSVGGDKTKLKQFPKGPFLKKTLSSDTVRIYLFDSENRLISFMPKIDVDQIGVRLAAFELRFSFNIMKNPEILT
jgi:hypothetical protein